MVDQDATAIGKVAGRLLGIQSMGITGITTIADTIQEAEMNVMRRNVRLQLWTLHSWTVLYLFTSKTGAAMCRT
jgi:hypothetical protein